MHCTCTHFIQKTGTHVPSCSYPVSSPCDNSAMHKIIQIKRSGLIFDLQLSHWTIEERCLSECRLETLLAPLEQLFKEYIIIKKWIVA